jgi:O-antigen/teichoic acid export membrane protein
MIITRYLGPLAYGDFKFLQNFFALAVVVFNFGFFQAGNRALVLNNNLQKAREYYGAELVILGILFILMSVAVLLYAFFDPNIKEKGIQGIFLFYIPFSWVFLLVSYFEVLFQADNRIELLAKSRLFPRLGFFAAVLIVYFFLFNKDGNRLFILSIFYLFTNIVVYLYIISKIQVSFKNLRERIKEIVHYNKTFGFNVYVGSLSSTGFSQLTSVLISYFATNNSGVGFFSLALTIVAPLGLIPNVVATTHYKDFSTRTSIPKKLLLVTVGLSISALVLTFLLVQPFITYLYGPDFKPVISLTYIVSFGVILSGFADLINRFLGSHGKGKALRNTAFVVGFSLMALNFGLIPKFGETGAAYAQLFSGFIYVIFMYWYYKKLVRDLKKNEQ